ncbi:hypothetical protein GCM10027610_093820 [Dactylosporangium cerinum]
MVSPAGSFAASWGLLQADVNAAAMLKPTAANSSRRGALVCRITIPPCERLVKASACWRCSHTLGVA